MLPLPDGHGQITLPCDLVGALTAHAEFTVRVEPGTGYSLTHDWWSATVDDLDVGACEFGLDPTMAALTQMLRVEAATRLEDPRYESVFALALLTRLKLADDRNVLGAVVEEACEYPQALSA